MCQFASFVLTRDRVFWLPRSDSHEQIICDHELHADGARETNVVRVELLPPAHEHWRDLSRWQFSVDQDWLPEWHQADPVETEARTRTTAGLRQSIDPAWWRTQVAVRAKDWTAEQRNELLKSHADLSRAYLSGANLYGANLSRANLYGADLSGADRGVNDQPIPGWKLTDGGVLVKSKEQAAE